MNSMSHGERKGLIPWRKQDLAQQIDVTPGYVSNIMSGERPIPLDRGTSVMYAFWYKTGRTRPDSQLTGRSCGPQYRSRNLPWFRM